MSAIDRYLANLVDVVEGPEYTNNPADHGGPTKYGVTQRALAAYRGHPVTADDVRNLTRDEALAIARADYVVLPGFDKVAAISPAVAIECIDTGYNMGPQVATVILQRCLNVLNESGQDLKVDGACGQKTCDALKALLLQPDAALDLRVLLEELNCEQGARYVSIAEADRKQRRFVRGWFRQRVQLVPDAAFYGVSV